MFWHYITYVLCYLQLYKYKHLFHYLSKKLWSRERKLFNRYKVRPGTVSSYLLNQIDGRLEVKPKVDELPLDSLPLILFLFQDKHLEKYFDKKKKWIYDRQSHQLHKVKKCIVPFTPVSLVSNQFHIWVQKLIRGFFVHKKIECGQIWKRCQCKVTKCRLGWWWIVTLLCSRSPYLNEQHHEQGQDARQDPPVLRAR